MRMGQMIMAVVVLAGMVQVETGDGPPSLLGVGETRVFGQERKPDREGDQI